MAHKNPVQLKRLIECLSHPMFDIYIHIDKKVEIEQFKILGHIPNLYFFKKRSKCNWGGFTLFKGIIDCLTEVLEKDKKYGFINLISGQDYPIQSADNIYEYFKKNKEKIFISFEGESSNSKWWETAKARYQKYHLTDFKFKGQYFLQSIINKLAPLRRFPEEMDLYGSNKACWWTLNRESAEHVITKLNGNPEFYKFLRYCWGTDEFVIPTLIMNSPLRKNVVNDNLRYIDWSEGNANPKILLKDDFEAIDQSNMLFARKFDIEIDGDILDMLDKKKNH